MKKEKSMYVALGVLISIIGIIFIVSNKQNTENKTYYWYQKTNESVTYNTIKLSNVDVKSFSTIFDTPSASPAYAKDKNNIFAGDQIISGADRDSFEIVFFNNGQQAPYISKDKNNVYFSNIAINKADPKTFKYIGDNFSKDKFHVFHETEIISGADPKTFVYLTSSLGKDINNVYVCSKILSGENPVTFNFDGIFGHGNFWYNVKDCNQVITGDSKLSLYEFSQIQKNK